MATTSKKATAKPKATLQAVPPKAAPAGQVETGTTAIKPLVVTDSTAAIIKAPELKKRELVERVIAKNGMKRRDVKPVVETILEVLGEAIYEGETLNLQPLGKVMVKRTNDAPNAKVSVVKIRQRKVSP